MLSDSEEEPKTSPFADPSQPQPPPPQVEVTKKSALQTVLSAKVQLRRILPHAINLDSQRHKIEKLIKFLESQNNRPLTDGFAELGLQGNWQLLYTTTTLGTPSAGLRLRRVEQEFDVDKKVILNKVRWSLLDEDCHGSFTVKMAYKFVGPGRLSLEVKDYLLKPSNKMPKNPKQVAEQIQRALPREFFDANESLVDLTYCDPEMRISRFMGRRYAGVRNILVRGDVDGQRDTFR